MVYMNEQFRNYAAVRKKFGKTDFDFMPLTFILPADKKKISRHMSKHPDSFWIIKPPNLYCGMGIKVINKFNEIPNKKSQLCVQSYIKNPYLINNLKFDLRLANYILNYYLQWNDEHKHFNLFQNLCTSDKRWSPQSLYLQRRPDKVSIRYNPFHYFYFISDLQQRTTPMSQKWYPTISFT